MLNTSVFSTVFLFFHLLNDFLREIFLNFIDKIRLFSILKQLFSSIFKHKSCYLQISKNKFFLKFVKDCFDHPTFLKKS